MVSSKLASLGLMQAIISVRLLPPSESCRMRVSLLSRYLQSSLSKRNGAAAVTLGIGLRNVGGLATHVTQR
jgi:hypothetical protein